MTVALFLSAPDGPHVGPMKFAIWDDVPEPVCCNADAFTLCSSTVHKTGADLVALDLQMKVIQFDDNSD